MSSIQKDNDLRKSQEAGGEGEAHLTPTDQQSNGSNGVNGNIRKYLVLLQDCLAIKFVSISQLQQKRLLKELKNNEQQNHFLQQCCHSSAHCFCSQDRTLNEIGCQAAATPSTNFGKSSCGCCPDNMQTQKCDLKPTGHNNQQGKNNEDSSQQKEDHHESPFYHHYQPNQASYPYHQHPQSPLPSYSNSLGKINSLRRDSSHNGNSPIGYHVNHQEQLQIPSMINKSNKSNSSPSGMNKRDYELIGNGSIHFRSNSRCSNHTNGEIESDQQAKHIFSSSSSKRQYGPTQRIYNDSLPPLPLLNDQRGKGTSPFATTAETLKDEAVYSARNNICRAPELSSTKPCLQDITAAVLQNSSNSSMMTKVDHSMQALFLYKEFQEINLRCFWNSALHEAFEHLEFKGSIVPSTIIVGSSIRKHLTVLKTAWSRKMLKNPSGYLIDFVGEIDELIADPIAKSHFVPLSDSVCWAIHELTSSGQESFADDIFLNLASAFPSMALPSKELIYQTLEKLTRERKIYQTTQGYYIITPDAHRYIISTEPLLLQGGRVESQLAAATAADLLRNKIILQQSSILHPSSFDEKDGIANAPQTHGEEQNLDLPRDSLHSQSPDPDTYSLPYGTFKRYNSLRIKKNTGTGCLPRRTLSMRMPKKSKSKNGNKQLNNSGGDQTGKSRPDVTGSFQNLDASQESSSSPSPTLSEQLLSRRRKHKSFLSRLLSFRNVRKSSSSTKDRTGKVSSIKAQVASRNDKPPKILVNNNDGNEDNRSCRNNDNENITTGGDGRKLKIEESASNLATISTQTSFSIENLNADLTLLALAPHTPSKNSTLDREDSDSGRCTDSHSDADAEITAALNRGPTPTMHNHHLKHSLHPHNLHYHHQFEGGKARNVSSCNVYEKIESDLGLKVDVDEIMVDGRSLRSPSSQMSVSPSPSTFTTASPATTYSRGNSMNRNNIYSRCHSSASSSGYSYRDFYNLYRRRYPSYYHQSPPTSLESATELLNDAVKFKPQQPIRYPPRSFERKQIFDEISKGSFKEKRQNRSGTGGNTKTVSIAIDNSNEKLPPTGHYDSAECIIKVPGNGSCSNNNSNNGQATFSTTSKSSASSPTTTSTTTILTQTLKNTTNLELEFHLPLGSILSKAMAKNCAKADVGGETLSSSSKLNAKMQSQATSSLSSPSSFSPSSSPSSNDKLSSEQSTVNESSQKINVGGERESSALSEVDTMVNDLFTIKSFVKTNPFNDELSSTVEFKTRGNLFSNNNNKLKNYNNNEKSNDKEQNSQQRYLIETVSSKPFADIQTKFNRESEII